MKCDSFTSIPAHPAQTTLSTIDRLLLTQVWPYLWPLAFGLGSPILGAVSDPRRVSGGQGRIQGGGGGGGAWRSGSFHCPFEGPPNFIEREKTFRLCMRICRVLVLNCYLDPPPFSKILYPSLGAQKGYSPTPPPTHLTPRQLFCPLKIEPRASMAFLIFNLPPGGRGGYSA